MNEPSIDFASIEGDVDEDGLVNPPDADGDYPGVETRYARLISIRSTELFIEFFGDYEDIYVSIRVPIETMRQFMKGIEP